VPVEAVLFVYLLIMAVVVARLRNLFAAAMLTGIFSLLSAGIFDLMHAVDVAFTEAAVGAGISTVLMLATLALTAEEEKKPARLQVAPVLLAFATGAVLLYGTLDMPLYGDPSAPIHHHVVPRYLRESGSEIGIPNVVTSVLASYRGYDTFGELTVIFTAGTGVLLLLRPPPDPLPRRAATDGTAAVRMREKAILRAVTKVLFPMVVLFALYVQAHGDYGPGGGFQAGVILAAAFIAYGLIYGPDSIKRVARPALVKAFIAAGVLLYGGVGLVSIAMGGAFLDYGLLDAHDPVHGQHLGILLVELGVGITVAAVMLTVYYAFTGAEQA
jgi:multicomponent Na+:H+ antiporter subunit B